VSFHEFVRFILSPTQQEKLQSIITDLVRIKDLASQHDGLTTVRRMVPLLLAEAEKVMRTNQRLTATLRRLLDARSASERKRLALLLQELRALAASMAADPPDVGIQIDTGISLSSPFSRTFWSQPAEFEAIDLTEHQVDEETRQRMFQLLAQMHRLDWKAMRDQIRRLMNEHGSATLRQIAETFPPTAGIVELLGYLQIAQDDGHLISKEESEEIVLYSGSAPGRRLKVMVPLTYFMPLERHRHG
jgi:chromosome condensin MukBEF complex kleisin-like MukF subunit